MTPAELLAWLASIWQRVYDVFETWFWRIRDAVDTYWAQFWYVVVVWYGQAYRYFREKVNQLEDVVVEWYGRIRVAIYDFWETLWQALTACWGYIWDHFYEGYKSIIDYAYSARLDIIDTFTRFKREFQDFRTNPSDYIRRKIEERWPGASQILTDLIGYIVAKIGWVKSNWSLFWFNPTHYIIALVGGDTRTWDYFIAHPIDYINLLVSNWIDAHVPWVRDIIRYIVSKIGWARANWNLFWYHPLHYLITLAGGDTRLWDYFIAHPVEYIHVLVTNWLEEWRDYILGVVGDLLDQLIREVALHLLDWMSYIAPPIEAIDEMAPHFSPFTDELERWARAWRKLDVIWVLEAMAPMKAFAAELRGEEEMKLPTPSETILEYWQMLTPEQIRLIVSPPIKG